MDKLSTLSNSRDNNFNLIRAGAALGVFVSHCFPFTGHEFGGKPQLLGYLSLNVFFIISGFLVTKSYFDRGNVFSYLRSRVLRIFPGLILAVVYTVFIIGLFFSTLSPSEYLANPLTHEYLIKNLLLAFPDIPSGLPGVFHDSIFRPTANAPLWSLPYETGLYLSLILLAWLTQARIRKFVFTCIIVLLLICFYGVFVSNYVSRTEEYALFFGKETYRLGSMFMLGAILYLARHRIILSHWIMTVILVGIAISSFYRPIFVPLTWACLGYLVLYFAYIPKGSIRAFNRVGDYSYGIYIFGYPTQQAVAQTVPDLPLVPFFVISFTVTLLLVAMSWHWVEKIALSYKSPITPTPQKR